MILIDKMKNFKIYRTRTFLPTIEKSKKKQSSIILMTPDYASSKKLMNHPLFENSRRYESYYMEKDVSYYIGKANIEEINEASRADLPDSVFGIPEDRKYPLDTEEHVRSAIKLFGHAEESKKKKLAHKIINKARKYGIDVPETTQVYKYFKESGVLENDYCEAAIREDYPTIDFYTLMINGGDFRLNGIKIRYDDANEVSPIRLDDLTSGLGERMFSLGRLKLSEISFISWSRMPDGQLGTIDIQFNKEQPKVNAQLRTFYTELSHDKGPDIYLDIEGKEREEIDFGYADKICPVNFSFFPNNMGINLCSVHAQRWTEYVTDNSSFNSHPFIQSIHLELKPTMYQYRDADSVHEITEDEANNALKTIIFDIGGVLVEGEDAENALEEAGVPLYYIRDYIENYYHKMNSDTADIDHARIAFNAMCEDSEMRSYADKAFEVLATNIHPCEYTENMLKLIKARGYRLYYLSNWSRYSFELCKTMGKMDFLKYFDGGIVSYEVGFQKPDKSIYEIFKDQFDISDPATCLFLDDKDENVKAARACGMQAARWDQVEGPGFVLNNFVIEAFNENVTVNADKYASKLKSDINRIAKKYGSKANTVNVITVSKEDLKKDYPGTYTEWTYGYCPGGTTVYVIDEKEYDGKGGSYYNLMLHECIHAILNKTNIDRKYHESICLFESGQYKEFGDKMPKDHPYLKYIDEVKNGSLLESYDMLINEDNDSTLNSVELALEAMEDGHKYYLVSDNYLGDNKKIKPAIPKKAVEDKTERVRFYTSINGAMMSKGDSEVNTGRELFVHVPVDEENINLITPSQAQVPNVNLTGEKWCKDVVTVKCIGKIRVGKPIKTYEYKVGDSTVQCHSWQYSWLTSQDKHVVDESALLVESYAKYLFFRPKSTINGKKVFGRDERLATLFKDHHYDEFIDLINSAKTVDQLDYLRKDLSATNFGKIAENIKNVEKYGECEKTKNYYNGVKKMYIDKGVTSKDVELYQKWCKEVAGKAISDKRKELKKSLKEETAEEYLTENALVQLEGVLNTSDKLILFKEDAKNDQILKKLLYTDRIKTKKELINFYATVKKDNPWIKYTYPEISRYQKRNLFVDTSYYMNLFFENNTWTMRRGLNLYLDFLTRLLKSIDLSKEGYERQTIMIPVLDWDRGNTGMVWNYKLSLNPISLMYQFMFAGSHSQLKSVFGNLDILLVAKDNYFKINFGEMDAKEIKKWASKLKIFVQKMCKNQPFDYEDIDTSADETDSAEVIQNKLIDKIEDSRGVDLTPQVAKANADIKIDGKSNDARVAPSNKTAKPAKPEKVEMDPEISKVTQNQEKTNGNQTEERAKKNLAKEVIQASNSADIDAALDDLDRDEVKAMLLDLQPEDDGINISAGRAARIESLNDKFLNSNVKGKTVRDILNDKSMMEEEVTELKVSSPNEEWKEMKFVNFDKHYNIDKDILACFYHLQSTSLPIAIKNVEVKDNSTSEDRVELYTVQMEDYRGKSFTVKLDIPIMVDNRFLLRGNYKTVQTQLFNMPIIKTEDNVCQIISNYMKIFVRRFRTGGGRALPTTARVIKALKKYEGKIIKFTTGENTRVCSKYELPIDYIDFAAEFSTIETPTQIIYFDQDELRKKYQVDDSLGMPFGYNKKTKEIMYYNGHLTFTDKLRFDTLYAADSAFEDLYKSMKEPSTCTYSRASILNSQIPLVVICAYHIGLRATMDRAGIEYEIINQKAKPKASNPETTVNYAYIKFADGWVRYVVTYESSLLMSGLSDCPTQDFNLADMDQKSTYLEFLDNFGGRIKADGLDNFRDLMIDPMTKEMLEFYHMPTDYIDVLIYANNLLADNKFIKHTDVSSKKLRRYQLIAVYTYKVIADAYYNYAIQLKHTENIAQFMLKQSAVIDKFLTDTITSDDSVINALRDIDTTNSITTKGPSGMNADRAYSLDKRTYDESMLNVIGMSTGFAGNVGITRQATLNANVTPDGYIKNIKGDTTKMNSANTLTASEALTPFGSTHDDPFRTAMTFIQTAKHQVRTVDADPLLVTSGADEAMPYMSTDRFAFKAKQRGKVIEVTPDYILIEYRDGTKDYINLTETIEKNSDGGYYVPLKLDKAEGIKEGINVQEGQIIAYDRESYDNSLGESDHIAYKIGKLAKVAILNTDEGFEDSGIISQRMAEKLATRIDYKFDMILSKDSIIYDMVKVGDHVEAGDSLLTWQSPFEDTDANDLMSVMADQEEISELGKRRITSEVTGTVTAIKIFRTVETSEMSESLKKIVNAYEKPLKALKKKLDENGIDASQVPAHYVLPATGKLKKAVDSVLVEIYVEYLDTIGIGDKVVYYSANKAVEKNIFPEGKEPYTEFRPHEVIDGIVSETSIMKRMVVSTLTIGSLNKLMIELDRKVKDIMGIEYDDSQV